MGVNYLPYLSQGLNKYNGDGTNGDSVRGAGLLVNLLSDNILKEGNRVSDVFDLYDSQTKVSKATYKSLGASESIYMDKDNQLDTLCVTGDFSSYGPFIYGGDTYESKTFSIQGLFNFEKLSNQSGNGVDRVFIIERKIEEFEANKYQVLQERVLLDYDEFGQTKPVNWDFNIGRKQLISILLAGAGYDASLDNYTQKHVGNDTVEEPAPYIALNSLKLFVYNV